MQYGWDRCYLFLISFLGKEQENYNQNLVKNRSTEIYTEKMGKGRLNSFLAFLREKGA